MLAKLKEFIIVCIHSPRQLGGSDLAQLQQAIGRSKAHYWEELEPGIFLVYFAIRRGGRTKSLKLTAGLGTLKKPGTALYDIGVAKAVGELITETNWYGKIITAPYGDAVNQAMKKAKEDASRSGRREASEETQEQ